MKYLATVAHEGSPEEASRVLYETDEGACVDTLSDETRTTEEIAAHIKLLEEYAQNLRVHLARSPIPNHQGDLVVTAVSKQDGGWFEEELTLMSDGASLTVQSG